MHLDPGGLFAENARVLLDAFDPRARMLCAAVYAATLSAMDRPAALAFAALLPGALFFCGPLRPLLRSLRQLNLVSLAMTFLLALTWPGKTLWGPFTREGIRQGLLITVRLNLISVALLRLIAAMGPARSETALARLGCPEKLRVLLLLTLRGIYLLAERMATALQAVNLRSVPFKSGERAAAKLRPLGTHDAGAELPRRSGGLRRGAAAALANPRHSAGCFLRDLAGSGAGARFFGRRPMNPAQSEKSTCPLEVRALHYSYPDGHKALNGVSFGLRENEKLALVGPNGSGKSTLLLHLAGGIAARDEIRLWGRPAGAEELRRAVGLIFQEPDDQLFMPQVADDVAFGLVARGVPAAEARRKAMEMLDRLGAAHLAERPPHRLSGGEKRLAALAGILVMEPQVIVLDEPTSALDPRARRRVIETLRALSQPLILTTHDLDMALDVCSRAALLYDGAVAAEGPLPDLFRDKELLERNGLELPLRYSAT